MGVADEVPPVKIAVLGPSGAGKTTYLATFYTHLQTAVRRLTVAVTEGNLHETLLRAGSEINQGVYPLGTWSRTRLTLALKLDGSPILRFHWQDYSGFSLDRPASDVQTRELLHDLKEMEALAIVCDAEELAGPSRNGPLLSALTMANTCVSGIQGPLVIALLLTKADLIEEWSPRMLRSLMGFIKAMAANQKITAILAPVACGPSSSFVTAPLFHVLGSSLHRRMLDSRIREAQEEGRASYWLRQSAGFTGFCREIFDTVTDTPTDSTLAASASRRAIEARRTSSILAAAAELARKSSQEVIPIQPGYGADEYVLAINRLAAAHPASCPLAKSNIWR
jgi:hypothetical protein